MTYIFEVEENSEGTIMKQVLEIEKSCYCETSIEFKPDKRSYIPEDRLLYNRLCENLKSYKELA
jgi:hypothetical protein